MKKVQDLSEEEVNRIRTVIEQQGMVEGDLRKEVSMNIKRLIEIGSYRGFPSPPQPAGPRTTHPHQRAHPQRPAQGNSVDQEEGDVEDIRNQFSVLSSRFSVKNRV
jgi:small subunit ribosomal protein S13